MQKNETGHHFTPFTKINSKWFNDLNIRFEIIKTFRRKHRGKAPDIGLSNEFLDKTQKAQAIKEKEGRLY